MTTKHPTPRRHSIRLADHIAACQHYLDHHDKAARLVGLRAMVKAIDTLIATEYTAAQPRTTAQPERLVTRIRRFFHALLYVD